MNVPSDCRIASIDSDHAMILPHDANPKPDGISERTTYLKAKCAQAGAAAVSTVRMHGQSIMRVFIDAMMRLAGLIRGIDVDDDERQII
jgi:hypothetical protein